MSVNVPDTNWRRTSGNGEIGSTEASITTLSGEQLITLGGLSLIVLPGSYAPVPVTEWEPTDPLPISEWRPTDGLSDYGSEGISNIVDTSGDYLIDTTGDFIVDTGVTETEIPKSEWTENDGV